MANDEMIGYRKDTENNYIGEKINAGSKSDIGSSKTGAELMQEGKSPSSPTPEISGIKYGDPTGMGNLSMTHLAAGKLERGFYGHVLPEHFKKTNIISTKGLVR